MKTQNSSKQKPITHTEQCEATKLGNSIVGDAAQGFIAPTFFEHITLSTGHSTPQARADVATSITELLSKKITTALRNDGWADMKDCNDDSMLHIEISDTTLIAKLCIPCNVAHAPIPVVRFAVVVDASTGNNVWNFLRSQANPGTLCASSISPTTSWIGVVILTPKELIQTGGLKAAMAYADVMKWAGDFERCLAWGFVRWLESNSTN